MYERARRGSTMTLGDLIRADRVCETLGGKGQFSPGVDTGGHYNGKGIKERKWKYVDMSGRKEIKGIFTRPPAYCGTSLNQQTWNEKNANVSLSTSWQAKELSPALVHIV